MCIAFDVGERTALRLGRERHGNGAESGLGPGLPVSIGLADEGDFPRRGRVDSVDAQVDPGTGTIRCRAVVPDPEGLLMPGMFARVRLVTGGPKKTLLVRAEAVRTGDAEYSLLVVNDQGLVERRAVKPGKLYDGLRAVDEGLREGEWVIVAGFDEAKTGATVEPKRIAMPIPAPASP
jgi:gold/copper resistance efflux system membrane fusion protein